MIPVNRKISKSLQSLCRQIVSIGERNTSSKYLANGYNNGIIHMHMRPGPLSIQHNGLDYSSYLMGGRRLFSSGGDSGKSSGNSSSSNNNNNVNSVDIDKVVQSGTVEVKDSLSPDSSAPESSSDLSSRKGPSTLMSYLELSKFRLSSLVVATTGAGFVCSGIYPIDIATASVACIGTALCAASAGTFNQVVETERDKLMNRTKARPLPSGRVSKTAAIAFGSATALVGTSMLYTMCNPTVAYLGVANILMYAGVYTYSKPVSEANTWIGAIVGAIPPIMGWAAATGGSILEMEPIALGSLLFLWQFPHFFSLSWMYREDYARGGFQMVACNDPTGQRSADLVMRYSQYLTLFPLVTSALGLTSYMFLLEGTVINAYLLHLAKKFKDNHSNANARKIFLTSLWYLPALLIAYLFHSRTWGRAKDEQRKLGFTLDQVSEYMLEAKEKMKNFCLHEIMIKDSAESTPSSASKNEEEKPVVLCPKTLIDSINSSSSTRTSTENKKLD